MHSQLEAYLADLEAELSTLPPKARAEELREMRAHLEAAFAANREFGQSEDEATANALEQFGDQHEIAKRMIHAWQREEKRRRRDFWGAAAFFPLIIVGLCQLQFQSTVHLYPLLPHGFNAYWLQHREVVQALWQGMFLTNFGLAGITLGMVFPRRTVHGVCLGLAILWVSLGDYFGFRIVQIHWWEMGCILTAIAAAWAASRWRGHLGRRVRV